MLRPGRADRLGRRAGRAEFPEFDAEAALDGDGPLLFTGEMIYPWMFETDPALRPLRETAELLASGTDWPALYDPARLRRQRGAGRGCRLPRRHVRATAATRCETGAAIRGLRAWVTNEYEHDGLRVSNGRVLDRLIAMARGNA